MRRFFSWLRGAIDGRDILGVAGLASLVYGGEQLYPGAGYAAAGVIAIGIAALVR